MESRYILIYQTTNSTHDHSSRPRNSRKDLFAFLHKSQVEFYEYVGADSFGKTYSGETGEGER